MNEDTCNNIESGYPTLKVVDSPVFLAERDQLSDIGLNFPLEDLELPPELAEPLKTIGKVIADVLDGKIQ